MDSSSELLIKELQEKVKLLEAQIEALKARLSLDSHNSSRPPSPDSPYKKNSRKGRKKKAASKRSKGGQRV
jgi:hypothetical protein